jgi:hypothetical protein
MAITKREGKPAVVDESAADALKLAVGLMSGGKSVLEIRDATVRTAGKQEIEAWCESLLDPENTATQGLARLLSWIPPDELNRKVEGRWQVLSGDVLDAEGNVAVTQYFGYNPTQTRYELYYRQGNDLIGLGDVKEMWPRVTVDSLRESLSKAVTERVSIMEEHFRGR